MESFSLLTKYSSYYLSIPAASGDHTGGWAARGARAKINSLSARQADALVLICHQQQMMFGTQTLPQPPLLYTPGYRGPLGKPLVNRFISQPYPCTCPHLILTTTLRGGFIITPPCTCDNPILQRRKLRLREVIKAERGLEI